MAHNRSRLAGNQSIELVFQVIFPGVFLLTLLNSFFPSPALSSDKELSGVLNINTATIEELQQLPFIGEKKAWAIMDYRLKHGPIKDFSILLEAGTIGQNTYEAIKPYVTLSGPSRLQYIGRNQAGDQILSTRKIRSSVMTKPGEVRILADGEYYDVLQDLIRTAQNRIDMAMFLFKITDSPHNRAANILDQLIGARHRGVKVEVLLENSGYDKGITRENERVAKILKDNDIQVDFDSENTTTHVKLIIIDRRYVFVGSHNMTHAAMSGNHELSLLIDNRYLAEEMLNYLHELPRHEQKDANRS